MWMVVRSGDLYLGIYSITIIMWQFDHDSTNYHLLFVYLKMVFIIHKMVTRI
jgi:hypothetical protein